MTLDLFGVDLFGEPVRPRPKSITAERFIVPPFSVLNARDGAWQDRKRAWIGLGIESEKGRGDDLTYGHSPSASFDHYRVKEGTRATTTVAGTSVFDPVLCEIAYAWMTAPGDMVLDPFAGGSVRGVVASALGRRYHGIDLRSEQVESNRTQAESICHSPMPEWVCGDSRIEAERAPESDLVFSCPPYGDLEVYSDNPADLSAMDWHDFGVAYRSIIKSAVDRLRPDRFACFVVGDIRDGRGLFRGLPGLTIDAFRDAGADLYNDAVMVTHVGSASMRVASHFNTSRKMPRVHQSVLWFVKGDPRVATARVCL